MSCAARRRTEESQKKLATAQHFDKLYWGIQNPPVNSIRPSHCFTSNWSMEPPGKVLNSLLDRYYR